MSEGPVLLQPPILSVLFDGPIRSGPEFKRQFAQYRMASRFHEAMKQVPRTMDLLKWLTLSDDLVTQLYAKECARVVQEEMNAYIRDQQQRSVNGAEEQVRGDAGVPGPGNPGDGSGSRAAA